MFPVFGSPTPEAPPNYSKQREATRRLCDALFDFLTVDYDEDEEESAKRAATPRVTVEGIVKLQEQVEKVRDTLEENRGKVEATMSGQMANAPKEMQGVIRLQLETLMITPYEGQLKQMEEWLSGMQAELEKGTPADAE